MAFDLRTMFLSWEGMGIFDIVLPFLLVFTIIFAILERIKILGEDKKNLNVIVALVIGLFVVRNPTVVGLIHRLLPNISLILVAAIMFLLLIGIFLGKRFSGLTGGMLGFVVLISLVLVIWSLASDQLGVSMPGWLSGFFAQANPYNLLAILGFVLVFALVIGMGKGGSKNPIEMIGKGLSEIGGGFGN
jgi:hypothetical protein